ncbi:DnaJ subfamily c member 28-like protein [Sesbania bispinosa]|nr:DnaJ subfamily c member 28-like protein [Sesbania bispinosa]
MFATSPVPAATCCSSSSSSSPASSDKSKTEKKKLVDRLSAVIDAVNDRKLPPELRGQRNNVSYCSWLSSEFGKLGCG